MSSSSTLETDLKQLVRFPTVSRDQATSRQALQWIQGRLSKSAKVPLHCQLLEHGGFPALVATTRRTRTPKLWLAGHIDVVPAAPQAFKPRVAGGKLHGRGALDMKGSVACYLDLVRRLGRSIKDYDFGIMLTSDEELGGANGTGWLLAQGYRSKVCFLADGYLPWGLDVEAKGAVHFRIETVAAPRHAALAWQGPGALEQLHEILADIRHAFVVEPCGDDEHPHSTVSFGQIGGGQQTNSAAAAAWAEIDIRLGDDIDYKAAKRLVETAAAKSGAAVRELVHAERFVQTPPYGHLQQFREIAADLGRTVPDVRAHGTSDARYFVNAGIPTVASQPRGGGSHSDDEWVDLADLTVFAEATYRFATAVAG